MLPRAYSCGIKIGSYLYHCFFVLVVRFQIIVVYMKRYIGTNVLLLTHILSYYINVLCIFFDYSKVHGTVILLGFKQSTYLT